MMRVKLFTGLLLVAVSGSIVLSPAVRAAQGNFSLQVTPSPLVTTLKPGVPADLELKTRNTSTEVEELKIEARAFRFDSVSGEIKLDDKTVPDITPWLSFSSPTFSVKPGEWFTQKIRVDLPKQAGFSYSFALIISRQNTPNVQSGESLIKGSVAVFTLINVDRPGAVRKSEVVSFSSEQGVYEYLPAALNLRLKNTGNTIAQPYGNIYLHPGNDTSRPLKTLPINEARSYLLPGTERTLTSRWNEGFPIRKTGADSNGQPQQGFEWNFDKLSQFRFGKYTARAVVVYNDGTRDVPVMAQVSFWVIPWKAISIILAVIGTTLYLIHRYIRHRTKRAVERALASQKNNS